MAVDRLIFHLTDRCQLNCDHCLRDPGAKPCIRSSAIAGQRECNLSARARQSSQAVSSV